MFPSGTGVMLALFLADPGTAGTSGEVVGGGYTRQTLTFSPASSGAVLSSNAQNFTNMPAAPSGIPYFGIFNLGGDYQGGGLTTGLSGSIPAGATVAFGAGNVLAICS